MNKYVVVYVSDAKSYLVKYIPSGDHYETVAEGNHADLKRLAEELNNK